MLVENALGVSRPFNSLSKYKFFTVDGVFNVIFFLLQVFAKIFFYEPKILISQLAQMASASTNPDRSKGSRPWSLLVMVPDQKYFKGLEGIP